MFRILACIPGLKPAAVRQAISRRNSQKGAQNETRLVCRYWRLQRGICFHELRLYSKPVHVGGMNGTGSAFELPRSARSFEMTFLGESLLSECARA